ncbi:iron export ABC transporter permease subunit FetB [Weissella diestrammenae]|uniref:Iron export ABC transporter permease subunit FetB n=1 Tax=Weissella diestrammenae TaxID=1162633 RepID=A0A7G9T6J8_9LACO|nr:iron export ABC transporter permease subunit FetB [Weissella diestrammenae]MCM0583221.1 iron export ABC transporter permease subunit FetB [Weissella diestrammenae]QNN75723.1 iron export ABC transporter permease subunit FetB [Weissella diestrammenae]
MNSQINVNNWSLALAFSLVLISLGISYRQQLKLEKETIISVLRAVVQLIIVGFLLKFIFNVNSMVLTIAMQLFIVYNAARNGKKRSQGIPGAFVISWWGLLLSTTVTMGILVGTGVIKFVPFQVIPVTGMVAGNSMTAVGLVYRSLNQQFKDQSQQVFEKLALGATPKLAAGEIVREAIRTGMQPTIDSVRTYGLVSLPGMMSGLIMAGVDPIRAIKYQIMVVFMLLSATGIASVFASFVAYKRFFNQRWILQLPHSKG